MATQIKKIILKNFKKFKNFTIIPNDRINILVGDNEVGKSSIIEAIDLVSGGNVHRVEAIGIDKLLNIDAVREFNQGERIFKNLPELIVELYLDGDFDHTMNGKNNSLGVECDGIRLVCAPNIDLISEITELLELQSDYFPYDYYSIRFSTFADEGYSGYKKKIKSVLIDSTNMNSEYATNDYIKRMYNQYTEDDINERAKHKNSYRLLKGAFRTESLQSLNQRIAADTKYSFGLKNGSSIKFENDLMIYDNEVGIDSKGTGMQVFIKTDFALKRAGTNVDVILLEEPENHLSYVNLRKLIQSILKTQSGQIFVTTHNSLISTRLELKNLLIIHENIGDSPVALINLDEDTAKYFQKAPVANIIEFALSKRIILVEGPSEYMLFEKFYKKVAGHKPEDDGVNILDIRGLSFKRYLEVAKILNSKVAVITDNDYDAQKNCVEKYAQFVDHVKIDVFYEQDNMKSTFEKVLFADNQALCKNLFGDDAISYMLTNKTEVAYNLLNQDAEIVVPAYIKEAIKWIRK